MTRAESLWTINELGAQVALALSVDYVGPPNGRVRDIPDQRTIRYYTMLGLMDRPADEHGATVPVCEVGSRFRGDSALPASG